MSERIEPALTPEEWRDFFRLGPRYERPAWLIAVGNAALPDGDPRKITREKIALLRIEHISECDGDVCEYPTRELAALADALESLLPPE